MITPEKTNTTLTLNHIYTTVKTVKSLWSYKIWLKKHEADHASYGLGQLHLEITHLLLV